MQNFQLNNVDRRSRAKLVHALENVQNQNLGRECNLPAGVEIEVEDFTLPGGILTCNVVVKSGEFKNDHVLVPFPEDVIVAM